MESEKFESVIENAGSKLSERFNLLREKAEYFIAEEIEVLKDQGNAVELNEDELRLLRAYQSFKQRSPKGSVFSWRIPSINEIIVPSYSSLIIDPREVAHT